MNSIWMLYGESGDYECNTVDIAGFSSFEKFQENFSKILDPINGWTREDTDIQGFFLVEIILDDVDQNEFYYYRYDLQGNYLPEVSHLKE